MLRDTENGPLAEMPDLILLDLNLPRVDGMQIRSHIRKTEAFNEAPVIVLTSSESSNDRESALRLGANLYLQEPTDLASFMRLSGQVIQQTARKVQDSTP